MVSFTTLIAVFATTQAHLMLKTPAPRGDDSIAQLTGPCGEGYDNPGPRAAVEGGKLSFRLGVGDPDAQIDIGFASGANPKAFPNKVFSQKYGKAAYQQIDLDFTKVAGVTNGPATIQIINVASDGTKYMCVDLTLSGLSNGQTQPTSNPNPNPNPKPTTDPKPTTNPKPITDAKPKPTESKQTSKPSETASAGGYNVASSSINEKISIMSILLAVGLTVF
ncbi:hypothetical protein BC833DRAFT_609121 [Globomyces pollinis-pini]|nr:hypothetical protein BC833DRAFT_609121 [Globomyces pollinis-pini]